MLYKHILDKIGDTPLIELDLSRLKNLSVYAKLEFYNPMGSIKDRAASYILDKLLREKTIDNDTIIIESSSGNMGLALAAYCKKYGLQFYCVIDPHISPLNENLISKLSAKTIKVTKGDAFGGYLLSRIDMVQKLLEENPNSYWINQYKNKYISEAYENSLGAEICNSLDTIDYVFVGVSSGGTIAGISKKVKKVFPQVKVIAVDIEGSVIFNSKPKKRTIPGIGSSLIPDNLKEALIDEVVIIDEVATVKSCHELLEKNSLFVGGSSGSVVSAIYKYFSDKEITEPKNVVAIFPDRGDRYYNTIYNNEWCEKILKKKQAK